MRKINLCCYRWCSFCVRQHSDFTGRLKTFFTEMSMCPENITFLHCIIHRKALCAKHATIDNAMSVVIKVVNIIGSHSLRHRQFQQFLKDVGSEYFDLPFYCQVRWLSRGKMLHRFFYLLSEVKTFMQRQTLQIPELENQEWICDLAFLADLNDHLNNLNINLQGCNT